MKETLLSVGVEPPFRPLDFSFVSRLRRSAVLYGFAWSLGAVVLSGVHVAFPPRAPEPATKSNSLPPASSSGVTDPIAFDSSKLSEPGKLTLKIVATAEIKPFYIERTSAKWSGSWTAMSRTDFRDCWKRQVTDLWGKVCTQDFLIGILNTEVSKGEPFNWSAVQNELGEGLFSAYLGFADTRGEITIEDETSKNWSTATWLSSITAAGVLHQIGLANLNVVLDRDGLRVMAPVEIRPDIGKAVKLYRFAAEAGDPNAQILLGLAYEAGRGVDKDDAQALKYFSLAEKEVRAASLLKGEVGSIGAPK